jgi:hypothetical protein
MAKKPSTFEITKNMRAFLAPSSGTWLGATPWLRHRRY